jgi:hypothetical protein
MKENKFHNILDYDIVVLFAQIYVLYFYKGILVEKDYTKAMCILTATFIDMKPFENYRKAFYYLGKICSEKLGQEEKSEFYFKMTLNLYLILNKFPYHYYVIGKLLFKGSKYINVNLQDALYFFNLGATLKTMTNSS